MRTTMHTYLEQVGTTLRPGRVKNIEATLREFAGFVTEHDPSARCVADLGRSHVEAYKCWLAERPALRGGPLHRHTIKDRLCALRGFFTRLLEWEIADAPTKIPVLASDMPIPDETLPRFLDDAAATKLLQAARADDDPFVRLTVEFLARTGMRKGEYLALTTDAVVQIGSAYWLHVPLGKLHTDRYIPLHPQLKELLDEWLAKRPEELRSKLIFVEQGRPIPVSRVDAAVTKAAKTAGIGRVSPHRLRHTLATQAINRGMSLEAIAALLGHRSFHMTLFMPRSPTAPSPTSTSPSRRRSRRSIRRPSNYPPTPRAPRCASCAPRCTAGCSATATARARSGWTATSNRSANRARSSRPPSSSAPPCRSSATTPPRRGNSAAQKVFDGLLARLDQDAS